MKQKWLFLSVCHSLNANHVFINIFCIPNTAYLHILTRITIIAHTQRTYVRTYVPIARKNWFKRQLDVGFLWNFAPVTNLRNWISSHNTQKPFCSYEYSNFLMRMNRIRIKSKKKKKVEKERGRGEMNWFASISVVCAFRFWMRRAPLSSVAITVQYNSPIVGSWDSILNAKLYRKIINRAWRNYLVGRHSQWASRRGSYNLIWIQQICSTSNIHNENAVCSDRKCGK